MSDEGMSQVSLAQRGRGIVDLFGVWWLIRRKKRIPQPVEVTLAR
jgi:hypothetical protein